MSEYNRKRNFALTAEPQDDLRRQKKSGKSAALRFVVQKHDARRLHYDFRLEMDGTLKSWAIPKGPSLDPRDKRLAVHVEDHPLAYATFEGSIPQGQYGGGDVIVWDHGFWQPQGDLRAAYKAGKLKFTLRGEKLFGDWNLVRTALRGSGDKEQWLLIKERDDFARDAEDYDIVTAQPQSVLSGALVGGVEAQKASVIKQASAKEASTKKTSTDKKSTGRKSVAKQPAKVVAEFPEQLSPELATLVSEPPPGQWLYEIKFDGYRILTRIHGGEVRFFTRNGHDWTERMPLQAEAVAALGLKDTWLDGEVVVLNDHGLPDFQALQNAFDIGRSHDIFYYLFDLPFFNGRDLRDLPVEDRRAQLEKVLQKKVSSAKKKAMDLLRFSAAFTASHRDIVNSACAMSLEGVIGKRAGSSYVSRRSPDWIKLKCRQRQEFVIVGFTKPQGSRSGFGALLLGVYQEPGKNLQYAGRVGTGFSAASLKTLYEALRPLEQKASPLAKALNAAQARGVHWVKPTLICEVEFAEWTGEGILRQAAFIALRSDKPAREIIREEPRSPLAMPPLAKSPADRKRAVHAAPKRQDKEQSAGVTITHPERIIDPASGTKKAELAAFYGRIAPWLLPHLKQRPVSLVRAPDGVTGQQFFQKHAEKLAIPHIKHLDPTLDPGHARLMEIATPAALIGAVQMGTIEFHTWGATHDRIEIPDRFILDLDPDPALPWRSMIEATQLTLAVLDELGLDAYLKTSGGKGIHILVPLARKSGWDEVKAFAKAVTEFMARQLPDRFVAKMGPKNRVGKIFVDYLRNSRGASTVSAYSVRARPGLPVSVPIRREELTGLTAADQWHIGNLFQRLQSLKADPWEGYSNRQTLTRAMWKKLGAAAP